MSPSLPERIKDRYLLWRYTKPFAKSNVDRVIRPDNTICLFCQPRSGSTWLAEIITSVPRSLLVDEPLWRGRCHNASELPLRQNRKVPQVADLNFYYHQPIPKDAKWPEAEEVIRKIVSGRSHELGLYREGGFARLKDAELFLIKFNHGQSLMHWFMSKFQTRNILLLRHPCAVIASQLKRPYFAKVVIDHPKLPSFPFSDQYTKYEKVYSSLSDATDYLAFSWCINTKLSYKKAEEGHLHVFYERMVTDYSNEVSRIFSYLGKDMPQEAKDYQFKPSVSTSKEEIVNVRENRQLDKWKHTLSKGQVSRILNMLETFEIDIYDDGLLPA